MNMNESEEDFSEDEDMIAHEANSEEKGKQSSHNILWFFAGVLLAFGIVFMWQSVEEIKMEIKQQKQGFDEGMKGADIEGE